jgi:hypothetical protein
MCCLLALATWQVLYLRKYFKSKKLIEWEKEQLDHMDEFNVYTRFRHSQNWIHATERMLLVF